ncbi:AMP-binding protein [Nocardia sp. alder85J]|uniref:AMP-binding protein n=1 Tax=Nocardia sp. alder85J TaxID=2862949 RepID=UPI001CD1A167|nr:AMP-binding protein [Nocardia sp. alder85J]MCX4092656.1 AMP-binding protein [Nocardia sp. alder85J]
MGEPIPLGRLLTELAARDPDRPAVTDDQRTVSRGELEAGANRLARAYRGLGVTEGDLVTVGLSNGIPFYTTVFALWKLGAVPQLISPALPAPERDAILRLARPVLVVGVDPDRVPGEFRCAPDDLLADPALDGTPLPDSPVAPAWKAPTSGGSTGRPKLIVAGQRGELDVAPIAATLRQHDGQVQLVCGPLYHNAPFNFSMYGLLAGQQLVVLPKFDTVAALTTIARHRVQWISLVPTMMSRMHRELSTRPGDYDIGSLRSVWHGAAACPPWLKRAWIDLVGADRLFEMYATTESTMMTLITGTEWLAHPGSVGRPLFGRVRILDDAGREAPAGVNGEIFVRPDEGAAATYRYVGATPRRVDGWDSVGDLGRVDAEGYLYIDDRRADLIVTGGANVYPAEVEAVLTEHPGVRGVVVLGLPDDDLGHRVHAVIETSEPLADSELRAFVGARLARYKVPREFTYTEAALRDDAGKVRRAALAATLGG